MHLTTRYDQFLQQELRITPTLNKDNELCPCKITDAPSCYDVTWRAITSIMSIIDMCPPGSINLLDLINQRNTVGLWLTQLLQRRKPNILQVFLPLGICLFQPSTQECSSSLVLSMVLNFIFQGTTNFHWYLEQQKVYEKNCSPKRSD